MQYFISFLEGIITFISPCLLPMLPVYVSYFAGGENNRKRTFKSALGFVLGFTIIFVCMGAFAGGLGRFLKKSQSILNIVCGLVVIIFGLNFMGVLKISFLNTTKKWNAQVEGNGFFRSVLFGMVFSIGWTPCVGTFLGSALLMASLTMRFPSSSALEISFQRRSSGSEYQAGSKSRRRPPAL